MVDRFVSCRTGPAQRAGEPGAVIRRDRHGAVEMVNLIWGFAAARGERPFTLARSETRRFGARRCLIPASEFYVADGKSGHRRRWRVTMTGGQHFYLAGIWRPAQGDWPPSYAILTIPANPDIRPCHGRQMAVIPKARRFDWLDHLAPEAEMLTPLRRGSFYLEQVEGPTGRRTIVDGAAEEESPALAAAAGR